jgi:hypothetical protein
MQQSDFKTIIKQTIHQYLKQTYHGHMVCGQEVCMMQNYLPIQL